MITSYQLKGFAGILLAMALAVIIGMDILPVYQLIFALVAMISYGMVRYDDLPARKEK